MGFRFDAIEKMAGRLVTSRVETHQTEAQGEKAPRKSEAPRRSERRRPAREQSHRCGSGKGENAEKRPTLLVNLMETIKLRYPGSSKEDKENSKEDKEKHIQARDDQIVGNKQLKVFLSKPEKRHAARRGA